MKAVTGAFPAIVWFYCSGRAAGCSPSRSNAKGTLWASFLCQALGSGPPVICFSNYFAKSLPCPCPRRRTVPPGNCNPLDISKGAGCKTRIFSIWKTFERGS